MKWPLRVLWELGCSMLASLPAPKFPLTKLSVPWTPLFSDCSLIYPEVPGYSRIPCEVLLSLIVFDLTLPFKLKPALLAVLLLPLTMPAAPLSFTVWQDWETMLSLTESRMPSLISSSYCMPIMLVCDWYIELIFIIEPLFVLIFILYDLSYWLFIV